METADLESMKLSDLFDLGWKCQRELNASTLCEQSSEYLNKRKKCIEILKKCEFMLDELHLYSDNEDIDEVSTSELRYFLNFALLGWLYNKVNSNKSDIRLAALLEAKSYYLKYLALTKNYELHNFTVEKMDKNNNDNDNTAALEKVVLNVDRQKAFDANLTNMAYDRSEKIKRYKEQKEFEKQMEKMSGMLDSANRAHVDDEAKRNYFIMTLKYWINNALNDYKCIDDEINILKSVEQRKADNPEQVNRMYASIGGANSAEGPQQPPKKPFIITKDSLQAKVFGMGYPSLPVYSIEEFYDQKVEDGCMPPALEPGKGGVQVGGGVTDSQKEDDKAKKEELEDAHDEEELYKQRSWDEFKDDNKRGAGNTYNRS